MDNALVVLLIKGLASAGIVSVLVAGLRNILPKIPRAVVPFLAVALGAVAEWITTQATGAPMSPILAALYGTGAVWLRETITTIQEHGTGS